jgi:hypothetical protein
MDKKKPKSSSAILKSLHTFLSGPKEDVKTIPMAEIDAYLKENGIDTTPIENDVLQRVAKLMAETELAEARGKRVIACAFMEKEPTRRGEAVAVLREKIDGLITDLMKGNPELASVYFRKYDEAKEEDLASLLDDLTHLTRLKD